jgi:hypothetical protein
MTSSSIYARFASLATSLGILVVGSHPKLFLRFGLNLKLLWLGQSIKNKHPLYFWITNKMVFVVVVACACSFFTEDGVTGSARQLDLLLVQCLLCA